MRKYCYSVCLAAILVIATSSASAQLAPVVQESGQITISVDGEGNNVGTGTVRVDKPVGATVRSAYLTAASHSSRTIADGDITLAGTPVNWSMSVFNGLGGSPMFFNNVFADVTSIVGPVIDAAPAGINLLTVTESGTGSIDGVALAVIFDDPGANANNGITLFFGGQAPTGDQFIVNLAAPIDPNAPGAIADLGLAISFSFQGSTMVSNIDVNGQRMTSSAGGQDDGAASGGNGRLVTVGGIGDSNANPDPLAGPGGDPTFDDELYSLLPFINAADMQITIDTVNPTDDDNIWFGYLVTSVPSAVGESILLGPLDATCEIGQNHTVTATVVDDNNMPVLGRDVTFSVVSGPNAGQGGMAMTDAAGMASFSYTSAAAGKDVIVATMIGSTSQTQTSNTVCKTWVNPECFMIIGVQPVTIDLDSNDMLLVMPADYRPLSLDNVPGWTLPNSPALYGLPVHVQALMYNPAFDPNDPVKLSPMVTYRIGIDSWVTGTGSGLNLAPSGDGVVHPGDVLTADFGIPGF